MLLFVYVFGDTLGDGLGGRAEYVNYAVPGIILITVAAAVAGTAASVAMDMNEGIIARFAPCPSRVSVLTGHVVGSVIQTILSMAVIIGVALLIGFRPAAGPVEWVAAFGILAMLSFALIWLAVAFGLAVKSVETASNLPAPLVIRPFLGSGFAPTDSLPVGLCWFAEYQPSGPTRPSRRPL